MKRLHDLLGWLDSRTGWRTGRAHLLEEPIQAGVGWWFVTGSILLMLLSVQLITGLVLAMYYVPSPEHAYDSIRYVMERVTFGRVLRGLHFFGASFIVVAAVMHMLRVVALGSYKKPREVTWITGVVLLLVILGFALTGYLLPWDQKAYWATTVTINIARSGPLGEYVAGLMKGGEALGSLTLLRWYAVHVFLLPASLIVFVLAHLVLMRRHGISGALKTVPGDPRPFYPYHALKDTIAGALVFALLLTFAVSFPTPLDQIADPSDASYVPRPEWYFLSLFQLLKYFPGPLEPLATMVIPGLVVAVLVLLPFIDRRPDRHFLKRPLVTGGFAVIGGAIIADVSRLQGHARACESRGVGAAARRGARVRARPALPDLPPRWRRRQPDRRAASAQRSRVANRARPRSAGDRARVARAATWRHERRAGAVDRQLHAKGEGRCAGSGDERRHAPRLACDRPVLCELPHGGWRRRVGRARPVAYREPPRRAVAERLDHAARRGRSRRKHAGIRRGALGERDDGDRELPHRAQVND
jgi:ubiquinol-cytochrome c reductase cytochrome b subunit